MEKQTDAQNLDWRCISIYNAIASSFEAFNGSPSIPFDPLRATIYHVKSFAFLRDFTEKKKEEGEEEEEARRKGGKRRERKEDRGKKKRKKKRKGGRIVKRGRGEEKRRKGVHRVRICSGIFCGGFWSSTKHRRNSTDVQTLISFDRLPSFQREI